MEEEKKEIEKAVECFWEGFCNGDIKGVRQLLNAAYQENISEMQLRKMMDMDVVWEISVPQENITVKENTAFLLCKRTLGREKKETVIALSRENGQWKIQGKSVFKGNL